MTEITEEMRDAAAILGRIGGKAGKGESKRRSPEVIKKAVKARIAANRKRAAERLKAEKNAKE